MFIVADAYVAQVEVTNTDLLYDLSILSKKAVGGKYLYHNFLTKLLQKKKINLQQVGLTKTILIKKYLFF